MTAGRLTTPRRGRAARRRARQERGEQRGLAEHRVVITRDRTPCATRFKGFFTDRRAVGPRDSPRTRPFRHGQPTAAVRRPASPVRGPSAWNGSGSARPSRQSATYSASAGPCLKPCPEPPPSSHHDVALRVAVEDEVRVRRQVVLAHTAADQRSARERREAVRARLLAGDLLELARRHDGRACQGRPARRAGRARSSRRARRSRRGRRTGAVVLAEAGRPAPAGVGAEEEDVAARDLQLDEAGEEARQPRRCTPRRRRRRAISSPGKTRPGSRRTPRRSPSSTSNCASHVRACMTPASGSNSTACRSPVSSEG